MKTVTKWFALLLLLMLLIPNAIAASKDKMVKRPGDTFEVYFTVSENPNIVALAVGELEYDHSVFELVPSEQVPDDKDVSLMDNTGIQLGTKLKVVFKVLEDAPEGDYELACRFTIQKDVNNTSVSGMKFAPVSVTVSKTKARPQNVHSAKAFGFQSYVGVEVSFAGNSTKGSIEWISIGENSDFNEDKGQLVREDKFEKQFIGKKLPLSLENIDGYTGATASAKAVINALNQLVENVRVANGEQKQIKASSERYIILPPGISFSVLPAPGKTVNIVFDLSGKGKIIKYKCDKKNPLVVFGEAFDAKGRKWFIIRYKDNKGNDVIGYVLAKDVFFLVGSSGTSNRGKHGLKLYSEAPTPSPEPYNPPEPPTDSPWYLLTPLPPRPTTPPTAPPPTDPPVIEEWYTYEYQTIDCITYWCTIRHWIEYGHEFSEVVEREPVNTPDPYCDDYYPSP